MELPRHGWKRQELYELIAKHRCSKVINTFGPPSVDDLHRTFPTLDMAALQQAFVSLHREWWIQATIVYGIVRRSIDLSGPYESTDIEYLREHFHRGDDRHGPELLRWVRQFKSSSVTYNLTMDDAKLPHKLTAHRLRVYPPSLRVPLTKLDDGT